MQKKSSEPQWLKSRAFFPRKEVAIDAFPILQSTMAIADKILEMSAADTVNSHLLFPYVHSTIASKVVKGLLLKSDRCIKIVDFI